MGVLRKSFSLYLVCCPLIGMGFPRPTRNSHVNEVCIDLKTCYVKLSRETIYFKIEEL